MSKKKRKKGIDLMRSVRSPFATCKMTGAGAHKSKKDYDRNRLKREDRKNEENYNY